jgi:hypothetical protein
MYGLGCITPRLDLDLVGPVDSQTTVIPEPDLRSLFSALPYLAPALVAYDFVWFNMSL